MSCRNIFTFPSTCNILGAAAKSLIAVHEVAYSGIHECRPVTTLLTVFLSRQAHKLWLMPLSCAHFIVSCSYVCLARAKCTNNNNNVVGIVYNISLPISAVGYFQAPHCRSQMVANFSSPPVQCLGKGRGTAFCDVFFLPLLVSEEERDWYLLQHTDGKNTFLFYCLLQVYKVSIYTHVYVYLCVLIHSLAPYYTLGQVFSQDREYRHDHCVCSLHFSCLCTSISRNTMTAC